MTAITPDADPAAVYIASLFDALGQREPLGVLAETPGALASAIAGLSAGESAAAEAPGKWSVRQVVQHLADSELVGGFRIRMVLAHDGPELPAYDQDRWADRLGYQDSEPTVALADFTRLREANLRLLGRLSPAELERFMHHPERGDESIARMIRLYAGHDLVHRRQIDRIRRAIGRPA